MHYIRLDSKHKSIYPQVVLTATAIAATEVTANNTPKIKIFFFITFSF